MLAKLGRVRDRILTRRAAPYFQLANEARRAGNLDVAERATETGRRIIATGRRR